MNAQEILDNLDELENVKRVYSMKHLVMIGIVFLLIGSLIGVLGGEALTDCPEGMIEDNRIPLFINVTDGERVYTASLYLEEEIVQTTKS